MNGQGCMTGTHGRTDESEFIGSFRSLKTSGEPIISYKKHWSSKFSQTAKKLEMEWNIFLELSYLTRSRINCLHGDSGIWVTEFVLSLDWPRPIQIRLDPYFPVYHPYRPCNRYYPTPVWNGEFRLVRNVTKEAGYFPISCHPYPTILHSKIFLTPKMAKNGQNLAIFGQNSHFWYKYKFS